MMLFPCLLSNPILQFYLSLSAFTLLTNAQVAPPVVFPISNAQCPLLPPAAAAQNACGPFTQRFCETCSDCKEDDGGLSLIEYTGYVDPPKPHVVDIENYAFYNMMLVEYLVEFSKNPMPGQTPLDLPYCGINSNPLENRDLEVETLEARGGWFSKGLKKIGDGLKHLGKEIQKGAGSIPIPFLSKAPKPPVFLPRPYCIPKTIEVPVHFTIFTTNFSTSSLVSTTVLESQLHLTNTAFKELGISFFISSVSYHVGREWEKFTHNQNGGDAEYYKYAERIKAENRYGGNDEVNIWIVEEIGQINCETRVRTNGYCTLARNLNSAGHSVDGCAITIDTLPGVEWRGSAGTGSTLTHELGHWFDLKHIFPSKPGSGCTSESDSIPDTFQFPNNGQMYNSEQRRCCSKQVGNKLEWGYCGQEEIYNVTNYMSYSGIKGEIIAGNANGSMPWTTGQRADMFAKYFTLRRTPPTKGKVTCNDYPVFFGESASKVKARAGTFGLQERELGNFALQGEDILRQGNRLLEQLIKRCSTPPDPNVVEAININTGEVVTCDMEGNCKDPSTGPSCPDGSAPPCRVDEFCVGGSAPPCKEMCLDGSAPPCTKNGGSTCPEGQVLTCLGGGNTDPSKPDPSKPDPNKPDPNKPDPSKPDPSKPDPNNPDPSKPDPSKPDPSKPDPNKPDPNNPDPNKPDPNKPDPNKPDPNKPDPNKPDPNKPDPSKPDPNKPDPNTSVCPAGCNLHNNKCDPTTAPTCTFPDPRVSNPRGACACRPGYKSSGYKDTDTTKQWRLPVLGQEHRVWVAEGVKCDVQCIVSAGVGSCREVNEISEKCVSN